MKIAVIGSGYVGLVAGACFAELGHDVVVVDNDPNKYAALMRGECPIHERHLAELLSKHRGQKLQFSNHLAAAVKASKAVFIAVGTPPAMNGEADLCQVEAVSREIAGAIEKYTVIVGKSTVPVFTAKRVRRAMLLQGANPELFDVVSNPEFLREGTAVTDFLYPDRIVVGADSTAALQTLCEVYRPLTDGSYYRRGDVLPHLQHETARASRLVTTTTKSAELIKYASNAFLATKISFINAVATICESVGADVDQVRQGIGFDRRIGESFLYPGIGYGGSCFPKDLSAYRAVAQECGYDFRLLEEVMAINDQQRERFLRKVRQALWTLKGKRLAVLGLAFKGGTDDIRESPAISIVLELLKEGCDIVAYDPAAMGRAAEVLPPGRVSYAASSYDACLEADALLILTDWEEFRSLDLTRVSACLQYPVIVDGRNMFDLEVVRSYGFFYYSMGRPDILDPEFNPSQNSTVGLSRQEAIQYCGMAASCD